jgi:iron(III) transport system substrate-binding protein
MVGLALWALVGCGSPSPVAVTGPLVVYSGRSEALVGPLFKKAEAELGLDIDVQYGDTPEMVARALAEGSFGLEDLVFAQEVGHLETLAAADLLATLPPALLDEVGPRYRDAEGQWVATSARLRVLVVSKKLADADVPTRLADLTDPKWSGRVAWAPTNASFQAHLSLLRKAWGEAETERWLRAMQANAPLSFPKNGPVVEAVASGKADVGLVNHYYLHQLSNGPEFGAINKSFQSGDAGNVLMLSGLGVRKGSPREADAARLLTWMVAPATQSWFAQSTFEYPVRADAVLHPAVTPIDAAALYPSQPADLADLAPVRALLQRVGLQ